MQGFWGPRNGGLWAEQGILLPPKGAWADVEPELMYPNTPYSLKGLPRDRSPTSLCGR